MNDLIKKSDVDGMFYPADQNQLREMINRFIDQGKSSSTQDLESIKGIIAPHAGYIYSGAIAGSAYKALQKIKDKIKRVVILSPSHHAYLNGFATHSADRFETPLGMLKVDRQGIDEIKELPQVIEYDQAFHKEHALEVQLPFIQMVFPETIEIIPMVVSGVSEADASMVIEKLWQKDTLMIVSSDLSHFLSYDEAKNIDQESSTHIENMNWKELSPENACGYFPLTGVLATSFQRGYSISTIDLRNSGDTQGDRDRVVGYGAYLIC